MSFKHPHTYGLMFLVKEKDYNKFEPYRKKLSQFVKFFVEPSFVQNIAPQHLSICYFSYPSKYPEEYVQNFVPKIIAKARKYFPIKIKVKGLVDARELGLGINAICWNILDFKTIDKIHKEIISELKNDIEHFQCPDLDFMPHIGVALGDDKFRTDIKSILALSRNDKEIELTLDSIWVYYPSWPKKIFPIGNNNH